MICANCGHYWVAVYPERVTQLECPECGHMTQLVENPAHSDGWYVACIPSRAEQEQNWRKSCAVSALVSLAAWCAIWAIVFVLAVVIP